VQSLASAGFHPERFGTRAFRSPHHTASAIALVGGGSPPRPGEIPLAHHGVLFLDELPEFDRRVLEVLREPLESGAITISRAAQQADFPARFQLIAAMNPCPCGYLGDSRNACKCTPTQVQRYRSRISGPLLDRIDLHVNLHAVAAADLSGSGEPSRIVRQRAVRARARQFARQGIANARVPSSQVDSRMRPDTRGLQLLRDAASSLGLSARAHHRVLRVARTVADLEGEETLGSRHVSEALAYRGLGS